jgi:uncharacterized membrane protein YjgN (DUF898 family)
MPQPPSHGYGQPMPPAAGTYGPPSVPGAWGGAPPPSAPLQPSFAAAPTAARAHYLGRGGQLFGAYVVYGLIPFITFIIVAGFLFAAGLAFDTATHGSILGRLLRVGSSLFFYVGALALPAPLIYKFFELYYGGLTLDGQPCELKASRLELMKAIAFQTMLVGVTFGIYAPWSVIKIKKLVFEHTTVAGHPGRLTFDGDPIALLGTLVVGTILMWATVGLCAPWFANRLFSFLWDGAKLDGRPFHFRRDISGFFLPYLLVALLSTVTLGLYIPWGLVKILEWEADHVG